MKFWAAVGILLAADVLGAIGYVAVDQYVYANGIDINFRLVAILVGVSLLAICLVLAFRRRKAS